MADPVKHLQAKLQDTSQKDLAKAIGISPQYLCDILKRRRDPGADVLKWLGLEKAVTYRRRA